MQSLISKYIYLEVLHRDRCYNVVPWALIQRYLWARGVVLTSIWNLLHGFYIKHEQVQTRMRTFNDASVSSSWLLMVTDQDS